MAKRLSPVDREWTTQHVLELAEKWNPRPVSEARGDVTFLVREIERLWDDLQALESALGEVHEYHCGCERPGSSSKCVATPREEFALLPEGRA